MRLAVLGDPPPAYLDRIGSAWPEAILTSGGPADAALAWTYEAEPLLDLLSAPAPPAWVHTRSVGVDPRVVARLRAIPTALTTGSGAHGVAVAEHVLTLVLALLRRVPELLRAQSDRRWPESFAVTELAGRTVGVIGTGDVGRHCARLLRAFGTRVRVLRRSTPGIRHDPVEVPEAHALYGPDRFVDFLTGLDVLVIAAPLTEQTRGLVGGEQVALLAPGALLVNVARGPIVQEAALVHALRSGRLGGAALDVVDVEPLAPESPLWTVPNLLISPHCADQTAATDERFLAGYLRRVARYRRGERFAGVDPLAGY
jgi:phosphoglycerate dehydrogenase-like enzyme